MAVITVLYGEAFVVVVQDRDSDCNTQDSCSEGGSGYSNCSDGEGGSGVETGSVDDEGMVLIVTVVVLVVAVIPRVGKV